jgi:hypothetical protein
MFLSWVRRLFDRPVKSYRRHGPVLPRRRSRATRPALEFLEDRTVPTFFTPTNFAVGTAPVAQVAADFNGDGKADLAVVNQQSNTISVLLGNGDGTFQPKTDYATGTTPMGIAVGDFNVDGKLDLVVANRGSSTLSVLLGNGDGTFLPKTDIAIPPVPVSLTPVVPTAVTVGDFNGDGKADLAVATHTTSQDQMTLLLGNGNGTFQAPVSMMTDTVPLLGSLGPAGGGPSAIVSGDFNGDGHTDLVVVNNKDVVVATAFGFRVGIVSTAVQPEPGTVSVLLGDGTGAFQAPRTFAVGLGAQSVAAGDFNGDGHLDFAVSNNSALASVSVFMNSGGGNFSTSTFSVGNSAGTLAAGDFNGDGATDLAVPMSSLNSTSGFSGVKVFNGQIGGTLQSGPTYALILASPVTADLNGDGHVDLVGIGRSPANAQVVEPWLNNGNGTFPAPTLIPAAGVTLGAQASGDLNGDGIPDLVTASTGQVQLGLGDGRFGDTITLPLQSGSTVAAVDADGNGTLDVLVGNPGYPTGQVAAWLNSPGFDNRTGGAVGFTVAAPTQIAAGANTSVTVTAVDVLGNAVPGFLGTVDLDFTPAGSTALNLLGQYTFTAADNGRHTFLFSNLTQAEAGTLSLFAVGMPTTTAALTVVPAAPAKFVFAAPTSATAGTPFSFTITAEDKFGNVETGYAGTVHFSALANDTQALLPADYTFTAADVGTHTFTATLTRTAGATAPFIAATDVVTGVRSSANIAVSPLAAVSLSMSVASTTPVHIPTSVVVSALDQFGNVATGYTGTVHFASSDPQSVLPADYTFTAADAGHHTFTVTLNTAGTQTLSITDTVNPVLSSQAQISVVIVVPASFEMFESSTTTAGAAYSFTLLALDGFGNVLSGYTGTVHFSSSDAKAVLPADYTFTAADGGFHTFTATLVTAGTQSISVADTAHLSVATSLSVSVAPGAVDHFAISGPTNVTKGVGFKITVSAVDAFGNVVTGYRGAVHLSSTDPTGGTQNFTFSNNDNGVHIFSYTFNALGLQTITITDTTNNSILGTILVDVLAQTGGGGGGGGAP